MRTLRYAGSSVVTTDRVAGALVELTAALARRGLAEAVRIPVFEGDGHAAGDAELIVGAGIEMLSIPAAGPAVDPATEDETATLRRMLERVAGPTRSAPAAHYDRMLDDPEFAVPGVATDAATPPPIRLRPRSR